MSATSMTALLTGCLDLGFGLGEQYAYNGTDGADVMVGTAGAGFEVFHSSLGADMMTAKSSARVDYSGSNAGVTVYLDGTAGEGGHAQGDKIYNIREVIGSAYDDYITGAGAANFVGQASALLYGKAGNDTLIGGALDDALHGGTGDDKLFGKGGGDRLYGGSGADFLDGGAGIDGVYYDESNAAVTVSLADNIGTGGYAQGDEFVSIENVFGSEFADILTGNDEDNAIFGEAGNDQIFGLKGNDRLGGGDGNDLIHGGDGNDRLNGNAGDDVLHGDAGDDVFSIDQGSDDLFGGIGNDLLQVKSQGYENVSGKLGPVVYVDEFTILKADNKIIFDRGATKLTLNSVEAVEVIGNATGEVTIDLYAINYDVKNLWTKIDAAEQAKFADETEFLNWLGDDAGYNYEGL